MRYSFHAHCTEGMVEVDFDNGKMYLHKWDQKEPELLMEYKTGKHTDLEILHFIDCINSGKKPLTDGISSLQGLRVIWRLYEA